MAISSEKQAALHFWEKIWRSDNEPTSTNSFKYVVKLIFCIIIVITIKDPDVSLWGEL